MKDKMKGRKEMQRKTVGQNFSFSGLLVSPLTASVIIDLFSNITVLLLDIHFSREIYYIAILTQ